MNKNYLKQKSLNVEPLNNYKIVAVDGTYSNTNIKAKRGELETSLNMCCYDVANGIPLFLNLEGKEKKNKEVECLCNYLKENRQRYDIGSR
jgi:hypothetical protein